MEKYSDTDKQSNIDPKKAEQYQELHSPEVFELIRMEGEVELSRPAASLLWSGIAAGIIIGFSVLAEGILRAYLPDTSGRHLIENLGYSVGFLLIILARFQLFTENTITPILSLLAEPKKANFARVARLWAIVFGANVVGTFLFSAFFTLSQSLHTDVHLAMIEISNHMMHNSLAEMFIKGIVSGWMIAMLVWLLPSSKGFEPHIIILVTYFIAAGDFTHVVAGCVEGFLLVLNSQLSLVEMILNFMAPVLLGNIVGGTILFSMIAFAQVKKEI